MYLLDTVAFSEFFKRRQNPEFSRWLSEKPDESLFVSAVTIGEVEKGIERQRGREPAFAEALTAWLDRSLLTYAKRIFPVTTSIARRWGRLSARLGREDVDLLIAATALEHGLTVATRNVRHFIPTGVAVENPFEGGMTLTMYERIGHDGRRPSPFSWRIRYAFAHKGIEPEFRHVRFADVETIRALSGQHFVPIVTDGDTVIHDSWNIACYLEDRFPDRPSLFAGAGGRGLARYVNRWSDATLGAAIRRLIAADFIVCLDPGDRAYYRSSREAAFGCSLEEHCADRPRWLADFAAVIAPLEQTLAEQAYVTGAAPGYADYVLFSVFQYARLGCPDEFLAGDSALRRWRDGLVRAFDGLGDRYPGYPARG